MSDSPRPRTLVGTPDPSGSVNRRARLAWVAETLTLPLGLARQALRAGGALRGRMGGQR